MSTPSPASGIGWIDVHSHLIPAVDDGCASLDESLACARQLVAAGYTHSVCTPHIWPSLPGNTVARIQWLMASLQDCLDRNDIPLRLIPGGENNLRADITRIAPQDIVTYGMRRKYVLADIWADKLPDFFEPAIRWFQSMGMIVVLAHPERMRAVQEQPELADYFAQLGVRMQGNLQCFSDPENAATRITAEKFLRENRYFMLGSDLHNLRTLDARLKGLKRASEIAGQATIQRLLHDNPRLVAGLC